MPLSAAQVRRYHEQWHHSDDGVHVFQPEGGEFGGITIADFPGASIDVFRRLSSLPQDNTDEWELLCDEHRGGDLYETVGIRRQDLEVIRRELAKAASMTPDRLRPAHRVSIGCGGDCNAGECS